MGFFFLQKGDKSVKEGRLHQTHRTGRRSGTAGCGDNMGGAEMGLKVRWAGEGVKLRGQMVT